jgi:Tfp pilus assembly protein PilN
MKKINIITTVSPEKQHEIRRWFWMTTVVYLVAFIIGVGCLIPQGITYWQLQKSMHELEEKTKEYGQVTSNKQVLKKQYDELQMQESKIKGYQEQKKNPYKHIQEITAACGTEIYLESIKCTKNNIEVEIACAQYKMAQAFSKRLAASLLFSGIKIISLQQDGNSKQVRCTIKGTIIF